MRSVTKLFLFAALVATTSAALAQQRERLGPRGLGGSPSGAMLLGQKSVQEDLKLSEEQVKQVEEFTAKQREGASGLRDASREERMKRFTESREAGQKAVDTILNEEQRTRLKQISLQLAGPAALASPEVAEKLALTDEQKKSIEEVQSASREEMRSLMQGADGDRAEAFRKMQAVRQATEEKLKGLLTDEQKTKWGVLTGKKFEGQLEGPGGRGPGRGRRGAGDASFRREPVTTVLTADKSAEDESGEGKAEKTEGEKKQDGDKNKAKRSSNSKKKHARHAKHRGRGEHAARHHGRGPQARHAHHRHAQHRHGHHRRGPEHGLAQRGPHRRPHARFAHHGQRPKFGGQFHGRHFAQHGPHSRPHFGPGRHFGPGVDARRHAWNRMALAMGAQHGSRSFSHAGPRHHGPRGPHHFAHRGHGQHRHHDARFAHGNWRGAGQKFSVRPQHGWHRGNVASQHRGSRPGHGEGHGHDERRMSGGFGGPRPPHFAWHIERHREDGPGINREHGERRPPRMHPAGFKKRHHGERGHDRAKQDGDRDKHHSKSGRGQKADKSKEADNKRAEKNSDDDKPSQKKAE